MDEFVAIALVIALDSDERPRKQRKWSKNCERQSIILRYLASGNYFEDLKFQTATSPQAIGKLVIQTCEAIITSLKQQGVLRSPGIPSLSRVWQHVKFSDVSLGTRPQYSLYSADVER
ncbi:hypothetical protein RRG08_021536 [Elysia crispata]|uniref:Uncharacterized protein n=1 Tax=Elysia crispata TaxID=231223 RepID=A0AAE1CEL0_9GAST|nr:hypothetical protein RRG08_021536 [Elysia crispata]